MANIPTPQNIISITYQLLQEPNVPTSIRGQMPILTIQFQDDNSVIRTKCVEFREMLPYLRYLKDRATSLGKVLVSYPDTTYDKKIVITYGEGSEGGDITTTFQLNGVPFTADRQLADVFNVDTITADSVVNGFTPFIVNFQLPRKGGESVYDEYEFPANCIVQWSNLGAIWVIDLTYYGIAATINLLDVPGITITNGMNGTLFVDDQGGAGIQRLILPNSAIWFPSTAIDGWEVNHWEKPNITQSNAGLRLTFKLLGVTQVIDNLKRYTANTYVVPAVPFDEILFEEADLPMAITIEEDGAANSIVNCVGYPQEQTDPAHSWNFNDRVWLDIYDTLYSRIYSELIVGNTRASNGFNVNLGGAIFTVGNNYIVSVIFLDNATGIAKQIISRIVQATASGGGFPGFPNSGVGNTEFEACNDAIVNPKTLYLDGGTNTLYYDAAGTMPVVGFPKVYFNGANWDVNPATGVITGLSAIQC